MIECLQVTHLRNLNQVKVQVAACNIIIGANGSGKTSLLESIFLLSRGKSFRHSQPRRYIQHHQPATIVHARLTDGSTLAIQKQTDATTRLRLNNTTVYSQSILTEQLPTLLIDPSTMDMLEQGSASRRQLLDWLVFHMKQGFHAQWVAYQRLLKQRNSLLKQCRSLTSVQLTELRAWDRGIANHAALIHHYRSRMFEAWQPYFADSVTELLPAYAQQLSLSYSAGYDTSVSLDVQLGERLMQDLQLGYTRIGSHRADVHVHWHSADSAVLAKMDIHTETGAKRADIKEQAANVLSRGEKKLLITALRLSQLPLLFENERESEGTIASRYPKTTPVVLLDDITAELDDRALDILLSTLAALPCQVFISSLTADIVPRIHKYWSTSTMFHVKQGVVSAF